MYDERIENLINAALADGELTEKEKQILFKNAQEQGIDLDEFEMVLEARLTELEKAQKEAAPKSNKYGDVRKCPACGSLVPAFKGVCQECGFEFANVDANLSSKQLAEKLLKESSENKKIEIIETFPIPTSKADLLEFLTSLKPRVLGEHNQYTDAYFKKYQECIEKARIAFEGDKQLQPFVEGFAELEKKVKDLKKSHVRKSKRGDILSSIWAFALSFPKLSIAIVVIVAAIIFGVVDGISSSSQQKSKQKEIEAFQQILSEGDLDEAKSKLSKFNSYSNAQSLVEAYIAKDDVENAIYVFEKIGPAHCNRYEMKFDMYCHGDYEKTCMKLIYEKLIELNQFDKAWEYHPLDYEGDTYVGNASCFYQYMTDVIIHLCQKGEKAEAKNFVNKNVLWFQKYVDNGKHNEDHIKDFSHAVVKRKLLGIINEY